MVKCNNCKQEMYFMSSTINDWGNVTSFYHCTCGNVKHCAGYGGKEIIFDHVKEGDKIIAITQKHINKIVAED